MKYDVWIMFRAIRGCGNPNLRTTLIQGSQAAIAFEGDFHYLFLYTFTPARG
jgi:hypothetical protein